MTLEEFGNKLGDLIVAKSPENYSKAILNRVLKNNDCEEYHLSIHIAGTDTSPSIDIKPLYDAVEIGEYSIERVADVLYQKLANYPKTNIDVSRFKDFNWVKENVYLKLINYEANKAFLEEVPHIRFLDLAVVFYVELIIDDFGVGTVTITNKHLACWKTDADELYDLALKNNKVNKPIRVFRISDFMPRYAEFDTGMIFISNSKMTNGAVVMLYDGVFEDNVYVIPSSIHECIVIPVDNVVSATALKNMLQIANRNEVKPQEVLSNNVYLYKDGKLSIVGE